MHSHSSKSGIDVIHGVLDLVMLKLGQIRHKTEGYDIVLSEHPTYLDNMQVEIRFKGEKIGNFGIVHPEVLEFFKVKYPVCALEIYVDKIIEDYIARS